jgi:hypothetical protein
MFFFSFFVTFFSFLISFLAFFDSLSFFCHYFLPVLLGRRAFNIDSSKSVRVLELRIIRSNDCERARVQDLAGS